MIYEPPYSRVGVSLSLFLFFSLFFSWFHTQSEKNVPSHLAHLSNWDVILYQSKLG